jgi:hypothetical protein
MLRWICAVYATKACSCCIPAVIASTQLSPRLGHPFTYPLPRTLSHPVMLRWISTSTQPRRDVVLTSLTSPPAPFPDDTVDVLVHSDHAGTVTSHPTSLTSHPASFPDATVDVLAHSNHVETATYPPISLTSHTNCDVPPYITYLASYLVL